MGHHDPQRDRGNVNGSFEVMPNLGGDNGSQRGGHRVDWGAFATVNAISMQIKAKMHKLRDRAEPM